jgi:heat shock protein HtpX
VTLKEQIRSNRWRTLLLLVLFGLLIGALAASLGFAYDLSLLVVIGVIGLVYAVISWFSAGRMVAAMTGARPADRAQYPRLYHLVETAAIGAGLDKVPDVRVIDDPAPNAFAAGRKPSVAYVAVTTGLLDLLSERELEGVIAHEISHVRNRDVRLMTLVAVLVGVIALISDILLRIAFYGGARGSKKGGLIALILALVGLIIAPIAAFLIQLAISRRREYLADASAAEITGDGEGLALALQKLLVDKSQIKRPSRAVAHLYIESPLNQASGAQASLRGIFQTHPPLEKRIAALEEAGGFHLPPVV